jgi:hypothetical protein
MVVGFLLAPTRSLGAAHNESSKDSLSLRALRIPPAYYLPDQKSRHKVGTLGLVGDEGFEPPTFSV